MEKKTAKHGIGHRVFHKVHFFAHLGYFSLVLMHGPYHYAAGVLLVLGIAGWFLGEEVS